MATVGEPTEDANRLYFRQLLAGRDFAVADPVARQMVNFVYAIGDAATGEAVIVDPAYAVDELVDVLVADGMRLVGVLATHYHPDHIGGDLMGHRIEGVEEVLRRHVVPVHVQAAEAPWVTRATDVDAADLAVHESGDSIAVGGISIECIHTPGHTPGSQCFLVDGRLIAGDTLFLEGCGRTDLPGGDPELMFDSLHVRLARIPDGTEVYPGHLYTPEPHATLGATRRTNYVFRLRTPEEWLAAFGS